MAAATLQEGQVTGLMNAEERKEYKRLLDLGFKKCTVCKEVLTIDKFRRRRGGVGRQGQPLLFPSCAVCSDSKIERIKKARTEKYTPDYFRDRALRNRYGISLREYDEMLMAQCGLCLVCDRTPFEIYEDESQMTALLVVHHCHDSGRVIGLLCSTCNLGMGHLGDSPLLLRRAADIMEADSNTSGRPNWKR